jgi:hypothetical protein
VEAAVEAAVLVSGHDKPSFGGSAGTPKHVLHAFRQAEQRSPAQNAAINSLWSFNDSIIGAGKVQACKQWADFHQGLGLDMYLVPFPRTYCLDDYPGLHHLFGCIQA